MDECKPLAVGERAVVRVAPEYAYLHPSAAKRGRGLHSFTSELNLSAFNGIGGARRDCVARVKGVLGGIYGV